MTMNDEPMLDSMPGPEGQATRWERELPERIRRLLATEPYAVLCMQQGEQPYGSVVAFAASPDSCNLVFTTPVTTRKYRLLQQCDRVALVVDTRARFIDDLMKVEAVTATGRATEIARGGEFERWGELLIRKHPHLESFVRAPTCALFRVQVIRYFHVERFQEVRQWVPCRG